MSSERDIKGRSYNQALALSKVDVSFWNAANSFPTTHLHIIRKGNEKKNTLVMLSRVQATDKEKKQALRDSNKLSNTAFIVHSVVYLQRHP
jgi:hypothetical protein